MVADAQNRQMLQIIIKAAHNAVVVAEAPVIR